MKSFVLLACLALASAKPQGYSYSAPSAPGSIGSSSNQGIIGLAAPSSAQLISAPAAPAPQLIAQQSIAPQPQLIAAPAPQPQLIAQPAPQPQLIAQPAPIATSTIQKHIYVHIPPAETEEAPQVIQPQVQHQKHYKIIFIKAPSAQPIAPQLLQQQQINEEKTLVYVLVKKPEQIVLPQVSQSQSQTSKPEVYFIKYKTQKEQAQAAGAPLSLAAPQQSGQIQISAPAPLAAGPSDNSLLSLGSSQSAAAIQPRNPSPVYGPAR